MSYPDVPTLGVADLPSPLPPELVVLDVREPLEWDNGHIDGALHIPLHDLPTRRDELPDGRVLVVCKMGGRSAQAVHYLRAVELDAVNLAGGMLDWTEAGRPMVSELAAPPRVV